MIDVMRLCNRYFAETYGDVCWHMQDGRPREYILPGRALLLYDGAIYRTDDTGTAPDWPDGPVEGRVCLLHPPMDFVALCDEISRWADGHSDDGVTGERFGDWSVTCRPQTWQQVFAPSLVRWRRLFREEAVND